MIAHKDRPAPRSNKREERNDMTTKHTYIDGPIFKVQNGSRIDLHWHDVTNAREITVACNISSDWTADDIVNRFNSHAKLARDNERLTAELEMHAWEISPGMAMAKLDVLTAENISLKADNAKLARDNAAMLEALKRLLSPMPVHDKYCHVIPCDCAQGQARAAIAQAKES